MIWHKEIAFNIPELVEKTTNKWFGMFLPRQVMCQFNKSVLWIFMYRHIAVVDWYSQGADAYCQQFPQYERFDLRLLGIPSVEEQP